MEDQRSESIPELVRSVMGEAQALVHDELEIFKMEVRQEIAAAQAAGLWFVVAAVSGLIGAVLICVAAGAALAMLLGVPSWIGYAIVAVLLGAAAAFFASRGRASVSAIRGLPVTQASLKENLTWMQSRSAGK